MVSRLTMQFFDGFVLYQKRRHVETVWLEKNPNNKATYVWRQLASHPWCSKHNWFTTKGMHSKESSFNLFCLTEIDFSWFYHYFSEYNKIVNMMGWVKRFFFSMRHLIDGKDSWLWSKNSKEKNSSEMCTDGKFLFLRDRVLWLLNDFGHFRLKTKMTERKDLEESRYPILLPAKHPVVYLLILYTHV